MAARRPPVIGALSDNRATADIEPSGDRGTGNGMVAKWQQHLSMLSAYSCDMATANSLRKFAEQAIRVERVLSEQHVPGSVGRVAYLLTMADRYAGFSQKEAVAEMALPKDVVSKLVGSLVEAGLLTQVRESSNSRIKRLATTQSGTDLLHRLKTVLQPPRSPAAEAGGEFAVSSFLDQFS